MANTTVALDRDGAVATIVLGQPERRNRLDGSLTAALADACAEAGSDDGIRIVVLSGSGGVFATGMEPVPSVDGPSPGPSPASAVAALAKPVIAWVEGDCLDMGLELALACDLRVASAAASFGIRHVGEGLLPWDGGTQRLVRLVGRGQALRLLLTREVIDAGEASRIGLVERVGKLADVQELAERIAVSAPIAAAYAKEAARAAGDMTLAQGLGLEADLSILLQTTQDREEGLRGFTEHRPPTFEGR